MSKNVYQRKWGYRKVIISYCFLLQYKLKFSRGIDVFLPSQSTGDVKKTHTGSNKISYSLTSFALRKETEKYFPRISTQDTSLSEIKRQIRQKVKKNNPTACKQTKKDKRKILDTKLHRSMSYEKKKWNKLLENSNDSFGEKKLILWKKIVVTDVWLTLGLHVSICITVSCMCWQLSFDSSLGDVPLKHVFESEVPN